MSLRWGIGLRDRPLNTGKGGGDYSGGWSRSSFTPTKRGGDGGAGGGGAFAKCFEVVSMRDT